MESNKDNVFYVVGKITGDPTYKTKFENAREFLVEKTGHQRVIIPTCVPDNLPYECYAPISIGFVQACDCLFVLRDWKDSKGARAEVAFAEMLGKKIFYEEMIPNLNICG